MNSYFMPMKILWNSFVSATIAVVILTGFKLITDGKNFAEQDLFQVNFGNFSWLFMELGPFLILGILGGLYGYSFTKLNRYFANFRHVVRRRVCSMLRVSLEYGTYVEISIIVVITGLLNFPIPLARLSLNTYLKLIFQDCTDSADEQFICNTSTSGSIIKLGYIALQGFFLSAYSYGLDLPGGILMPTLVIGATTGRALGIIAQVIQSHFSWDSLATCTAKSCLVSPSSYAVIGAASFMTGITKLTMCVVVIMFEMTGAVTYVLPIMFGVMTSKFTNDWLCTKNIYDTELLSFNRNENGGVNSGKGTGLVTFSTLTTTEKAKLPDVTVQHVMIPLHRMKCLCIHPEVPYTVASIYNFTKDTHEMYPVITSYEDPTYFGYVSKQELLDSLNNLPSTPIQIVVPQVENYDMSTPKLELFPQKQIIVANPKTQLNLIIHEFEKLYINYMCILQDGKLAGFIDRFILTKLIESDTVVEPECFSDVDDDIELSDLRLNRKSIELIT
ncbi:uncharacterized protein SPAPADRAFT_63307 [Spathaspora passalidarum NRRL Y-27907]|uniref:Chloride channel protein n=1 Tax=Spathaspora passalidarum (strain NRRL Y-27907 / 11-Y1) TaxID=619300 RepID=G3AUB0_SPAPN|nr:uncharacterized protein SPAPADRAFT_63307 [Spathaspora passalidarum NRRL Y-27907]EGW30486.1 hypothetical protein SPAPADRAFT_63307 [Spathaspora passalidarum NRRL Y-27907]